MIFKRLRNLKLRTQLILLTLIFATMVSVVGLYLFSNINNILRLKIKDSTEQVFNHIEVEVSNYFENINNTANTIVFLNPVQDYINSTVPQHSYDLYRNIYLLINNTLSTNSSISSVFLDIGDMRLSFNDININLSEIENLYPEKSETHYTKLLTHYDGGTTAGPRYFALVRSIYNIRSPLSSIPSGKLTLILDKKFFDNISSRYGLTENSSTYIISSNNEIIGKKPSLGDKEPSDETILSKSINSSNSSTIYVDDVKYIYHVRNIKNTGWKVVSMTPYSEYFKELDRITLVTFILFFLVILTMLSFSIMIIGNITVPIKQLLASMENVGKGHLKERSHVNLNNEIGKLSIHFNMMMEEVYSLTNRIFENQQKLYEFELANKDARLIALQSQINPHFLYNTLACIQSIALHYKIEEISEVSKALARMFRYSIKENDFVLVSAEVENLRNYILIQQVKSLDKIRFEVDISKDIMNYTIIKLILQPVVENAVNHGLAFTTENGILQVKGYMEDNRINFLISDNGVGISPEKLEELNSIQINTPGSFLSPQKNSNIGLMNVKQRLSLCYNNDFSLRIDSRPGEGTTVHIQIPCMEVKYD